MSISIMPAEAIHIHANDDMVVDPKEDGNCHI